MKRKKIVLKHRGMPNIGTQLKGYDLIFDTSFRMLILQIILFFIYGRIFKQKHLVGWDNSNKKNMSC